VCTHISMNLRASDWTNRRILLPGANEYIYIYVCIYIYASLFICTWYILIFICTQLYESPSERSKKSTNSLAWDGLNNYSMYIYIYIYIHISLTYIHISLYELHTSLRWLVCTHDCIRRRACDRTHGRILLPGAEIHHNKCTYIYISPSM